MSLVSIKLVRTLIYSSRVFVLSHYPLHWFFGEIIVIHSTRSILGSIHVGGVYLGAKTKENTNNEHFYRI